MYVSSGRILPDMEVMIEDSEGRPCGEAEPGNIKLRAISLFSGYWTNEGFNTSSISNDGWYSTGDYGFLAEGEVYVIGRLKDIIIIGGQNVFPEDVETVINSVDSLYPAALLPLASPTNSTAPKAWPWWQNCAASSMRGRPPRWSVRFNGLFSQPSASPLVTWPLSQNAGFSKAPPGRFHAGTRGSDS